MDRYDRSNEMLKINTVPVEGKTKAAGLDGIAHTENPQEKGGKVQEMLENIQEGVVQALATQAPAAAAFAGMYKYKGATDSAWESIQHSEQSPGVRRPTRRFRRAWALWRIKTADHAEGQAESLIRLS